MIFSTYRFHFIYSILLPFCCFFNAEAQTNVSGGIFANTTWKKSNSPYIVKSKIVVFDNVTLTIEPGVVVKFDTNTTIHFLNSQLIALGTPTDSIVFTANSPKPDNLFWQGITVSTQQFPTYKGAQIQLKYFVGSYAMFLIDLSDIIVGGSLHVTNSTFKNNLYAFKEGLEHFTIENSDFLYNSIALYAGIMKTSKCNFYNNTNAIITGGRSGSVPIIDSCTFNGNTQIAIQGESYVTNCKFTNNLIGAAIVIGSNFGSFINNVVKSNQIGVQIFGSSGQDSFFSNTICGNLQANIQRLGLAGAADIRNNCWCTTDSLAIEEKIWDAKDDITIGLVIISPNNCASSTNICSISGIVHEGDRFLSEGTVSAMNVQTMKTYSNLVKSDGSFSIDSLPKGNYLLKAVAATENSLPTFYPNKTDKNEAVILDLQGKIIGIDIFLQYVTALIDEELSSSYNISPNPFVNTLHIQTAQEIEIKNITGVVVFKGKLDGDELNTSTWNQGVYFFTGTNGRTIKILKQ